MDYLNGLGILQKLLRDEHDLSTFVVHEAALRENLGDESMFGSTEQSRNTRSKIVQQLNRLAMKAANTSFNDLCLDRGTFTLPADTPFGSENPNKKENAVRNEVQKASKGEGEHSRMNTKPHTAFISYSHDCEFWKIRGEDPETQRKRVFHLAERLRGEGVLCVIDQQVANPPEGWPRWMMNQIEDADFVLVTATETYNRRFRGKEATDRGHGAQWEGAAITQEMYDHNGRNEKFIPVVFDQADVEHIPLPLRSATYYNVSNIKGYDELYFYLTNQPPYVARPLGPLRKRQ